MYKIHVENIRTRSYHGCLNEEAIIGGDYRTDVWIMLKDEYSIKNDELDQTVDYGEVSEIVYKEMKTSHLPEYMRNTKGFSENAPKNRTRAPYGEERIFRKCTLKIGPVPLVGKNGFHDARPR